MREEILHLRDSKLNHKKYKIRILLLHFLKHYRFSTSQVRVTEFDGNVLMDADRQENNLIVVVEYQ